MGTVLLVEDDDAIRASVTRWLTEHGYPVLAVSNGMDGLTAAINQPVQLVLLDLGLPDISGLKLIPMLRAVSQVPIMVITAQDDDVSLVQALDSGADDYVVKPFGGDHLAARIRAVLRRHQQSDQENLRVVVGQLVIDSRSRQVFLADREISLNRKEFDLLFVLASRPGEVISKRDLLAEVWRYAYGGSERTVDVHVSWLRRKLGESATEPKYLHSIRGVGVKLQAPVS